MIAATKYEKLLLEEQQVKHSSKVLLISTKAKLQSTKWSLKEVEPKQNDDHGREGMDMCAGRDDYPIQTFNSERVNPTS